MEAEDERGEWALSCFFRKIRAWFLSAVDLWFPVFLSIVTAAP